MSRVCYVQGLSCLGFFMSRVFLCLGFFMSRVCPIQPLFCLALVIMVCIGLVLSNVSLVQGLLSLRFVISSFVLFIVCYVQDIICLVCIISSICLSKVCLSRVACSTDRFQLPYHQTKPSFRESLLLKKSGKLDLLVQLRFCGRRRSGGVKEGSARAPGHETIISHSASLNQSSRCFQLFKKFLRCFCRVF